MRNAARPPHDTPLRRAVLAVFKLSDTAYRHLLPIPFLDRDELRMSGLGLLAAATALIAVAQSQMGPSFRIGIDAKNRTDLVERGLYRYSRNPIYVGLFASLVALVLLLPNALTELLSAVSYVVVQVQTRLEEEHMGRLHGEQFAAYRRRVGRWA